MPIDRKLPYYTQRRYKRDGNVELIFVCLKDNSQMEKTSWQENKEGIVYRMIGYKCPVCGTYKDTGYELLGPAGFDYR